MVGYGLGVLMLFMWRCEALEGLYLPLKFGVGFLPLFLINK